MPSTLVQNVLSFIRTQQMVGAGSRIGVAVSGGADSVVLLHILHSLASELNCGLQVLHVNHQLRGDESAKDETFVRELAKRLGLPFAAGQARPPSGNLEQEARDVRRAFFQRAIQEYGLRRVALGHTRSDQAETVLFRLLRGAGLTGLAGMQPVTGNHLIRPLLECSREEVRAWARETGVVWRDDSSNTDTRFTRNRLRLETLPQLAQTYSVNIEGLLSQTASLAQCEEDYWKREIDTVSAGLAQTTRLGIQFPVAELMPLHLAVRRRLIRHTILRLKGDLRGIEYEHVEAILGLCESEEGHNRVIVPGIDALRSFSQLLLSQQGIRAAQERDYQIDLKVGGEFTLPFQTGLLDIQEFSRQDSRFGCANFKDELVRKFEICDLDYDLLANSAERPLLYVRNWRPGDSFQRVGHGSAEKIKTLFQSERILLWERKHWPVVTAGDRIVWVRQFGGAADVSAKASSRNILRLVYRQP